MSVRATVTVVGVTVRTVTVVGVMVQWLNQLVDEWLNHFMGGNFNAKRHGILFAKHFSPLQYACQHRGTGLASLATFVPGGAAQLLQGWLAPIGVA
jgi:hypothetical protein